MSESSSRNQNTSTKWIRRSFGAVAAVAVLGSAGAGCLNRPVVPGAPTTKTNFTAEVRQQAVDKVDLLFMIDNSASMGDKQGLLALAVPDLMTRLVSPNCVDANGNPTGETTSDGTCKSGKAEFQPVHDMHVGIVSSALGGRGSDACPADAKNPVNSALLTHNDDQGHLLTRGGIDEHDVTDASSNGNFLAWFPTTTKNAGHATPTTPIGDATKLGSDFADMVVGVHEYGCGFEAQLESWYRFLIQPDPFKSIAGPPGAKATLVDVDATIIQQRHDFLRPDSLVAVIVLTDENDSTVDPLAVGGQGWAFENTHFPNSPSGGAARGTSACDTNPNDPACTSCGFGQTPTDPNCQKSGGYYDPTTEDQLNERFFHMKQRYGVDPQFPIKRYVNALTSPRVPDRNGEHPNGAANYAGNNNCGNPLFSTSLPDGSAANNGDALCNLAKGPRTADLIFFGVIGGIPWQLLLEDPTKPDSSAFKSSFTASDWKTLLGNDPLNYDFTGADPHMIESIVPRDSQYPGLKPVTASDTADPYNGREWDTHAQDLQYACTFQLPAQKDCADPKFSNACDCTATRPGEPPLCAGPKPNTIQTRGKAYPTIREFSVVRALGDQGIIASLCPRSLDPNNADYGYRPAVRVIVDRLKNALANQCLPQKLVAATDGSVSCLILLTLEDTPGGEERCDAAQGLAVPDAAVLAKFREQAESDFKAGGGDDAGLKDPKDYAVCQLKQLVVPIGQTCADQADAGWCYVENNPAAGQAPAGTCPQAILFTQAGNKVGAKISLQCIEANPNDGG